MIEIRPQPGPQEMFLSTEADIAIYGGAAGGGKTFGLLLEPTRHMGVKGFGGIIFRRLTTQITVKGGLWEEAGKLYPSLGATPRDAKLLWKFPPFGNVLQFKHLEYESDVFGMQGSQLPFIGFDELTHFTEVQFFYMLSRSRSVCGVRPYIRATCNPDADSWVARFISWWIDEDTGQPIPERSGVLRYFVRIDDTIVWADTPDELIERYPGQRPLSMTFIPATLEDNPILEEKDPDYRGKLLALSLVERERLLMGNWKIKVAAGMVFRRDWIEIVDRVPYTDNKVRFYDMAGTTPSKKATDPDWTVGLLLAEHEGTYFVLDVFREQGNAATIDPMRVALAYQDGRDVPIVEEQECGSAGKRVIEITSGDLFDGFDYVGRPSSGSKQVRATPVARAAYNGRLKILKAPWNEAFLSELHSFPEGNHDDQVDALSGAYNELFSRKPGAKNPTKNVRTPPPIPNLGGRLPGLSGGRSSAIPRL